MSGDLICRFLHVTLDAMTRVIVTSRAVAVARVAMSAIVRPPARHALGSRVDGCLLHGRVPG